MKGVTVSYKLKKDDNGQLISPKEHPESYLLGRDVVLEHNTNCRVGKVVRISMETDGTVEVTISVDMTSEAGKRVYENIKEETDVNKTIDKLHL